MHFTESCPSGRRSTIGNRVGVKSVSGVQIPDSPPAPSHGLLPPNGPCSIPCGGVAEWLNAAVSKTVYPVSPGTRVRIPPPPPVALFKRALAARFSLSIAKARRSKASAAAGGGGDGRQQAAPRPRGYHRADTSPEPNSLNGHLAQAQHPPASRRTGLTPYRPQRFSRYASLTATVSRRGQVETCRFSGVWSSASHASAGRV